MKFTGKVIPLCKECLREGNATSLPCIKHSPKAPEQLDGKSKAAGKD